MRTRVEGRDVNVLNGCYGGQFLSSTSLVVSLPRSQLRSVSECGIC